MGAHLHDPAVLHDHDAVRLAQGEQPVGDQDGGAALGDAVQSLLDVLLGLGVDARRRLVEDQDLGVGGHDAREGEQLPLAVGEVGAALGEVGLVALGQSADEAVGVDEAGGRLHPGVVHLGVAQPDVVAHGAGEDVKILEHDAQTPADVVRAEPAHVDPIEQDLAVLEVVEAAEQPRQGRLAGSGRSHDGELLARLDAETHVVEHRLGLVVAEAHVPELDAAFEAGGQGGRMLGLGHVLVPVEELEDALGARHGAVEHVVLLADGHDGAEEQVGVAGEEDQGSDGDGAREVLVATEPDDQRQRDGGQAVDERPVADLEGDRVVLLAAVLAVDRAVAVQVAGLAAMELDHADPGEILLQILVEPRHRVADVAVDDAGGVPERPGRAGQDREWRAA